MVTARQLSRIQAAVNTLLTGAGTIVRPILTQSAKGGWVETGTTRTAVAARLDSILVFTSDGEEGARLASTTGYQLSVPAGTDIRASDRFEMDGRSFDVIGVNVESPEYVRTARVREVV